MAFKNFGHQVEAIDFSEELVEKARQLTELPVQFGSFYELAEVAKYNGIWACALLLHCERPRLKEVIGKLVNVLKPKGVLYMSFKYGNGDREKDGRQFTDLNEAQAEFLLNHFEGITQKKAVAYS